MTAQDFGYFGKPFTASNNSMGALGGGLQEEKGHMDQNHDSNAAISGMWNIDYFHGTNKIVKEVVNGWTISPVVYLISGGPFTVNTGSNKNDDSPGASRPDWFLAAQPQARSAPLPCLRRRWPDPTSVLTAWFNLTANAAELRTRLMGPALQAALALAAQTATWAATP